MTPVEVYRRFSTVPKPAGGSVVESAKLSKMFSIEGSIIDLTESFFFSNFFLSCIFLIFSFRWWLTFDGLIGRFCANWKIFSYFFIFSDPTEKTQVNKSSKNKSWKTFFEMVSKTGFYSLTLNSQAPVAPKLARRGILWLSRLNVNIYSKIFEFWLLS